MEDMCGGKPDYTFTKEMHKVIASITRPQLMEDMYFGMTGIGQLVLVLTRQQKQVRTQTPEAPLRYRD